MKKNFIKLLAGVSFLVGMFTLSSINGNHVSAEIAHSDTQSNTNVHNTSDALVGGIHFDTSGTITISSDISYAQSSGYQYPYISFEIQRYNSGFLGWGSGWETVVSQSFGDKARYDISLSKVLTNGGDFRVIAKTQDGNTYKVYSDTYLRY